MKSFRRKYLTRRTITKIKSYSDLYREIILFSRQDWLLLAAILIFAFSIWYISYYLFKTEQILSAKTALLSILFLASFALLFLVFSLAYSATQNISRIVPEVVAHMIIFYPKPYQDGLGLDYEDIQQLKRISEIEQSSADWRSSFLNFAVISFAAVLLANFNFIWNFFIGPAIEQILFGKDSVPANLDIIFPQQTQLGNVLGALFFIIAVLWLLYKWFSYFWEFTTSEYANRVLLLACEELIAIYRIKNLPQDQRVSFRERRALLEVFGYQLIAFEKANVLHKQWAPFDLKENGIWFLIPPVEQTTALRIVRIYKNIKKKILASQNETAIDKQY